MDILAAAAGADSLINGIINFLKANPSLFTLLIGFTIGYIIGFKKGSG